MSLKYFLFLLAALIAAPGFFSLSYQAADSPTAITDQPITNVSPAPRKVWEEVTGKASSLAVKKITKAKAEAVEPLIRNWDLRGTGVSESALQMFMGDSQPEEIILFGEGDPVRIQPLRRAEGEAQTDQLLFLASPQAIRKVKLERQAKAAAAAARPYGRPPPGTTALGEDAFEISSFEPGFLDSGDRMVPVVLNFLQALQGPDYTFEWASDNDEAAILRILSRALTLGHYGLLRLRLPGGAIFDRPGVDFKVFENGFRVPRTNQTHIEFAFVGVSDTENENDVRWFPCDPLRDERSGCAGAVPTKDGGDLFDLAEIGVKEARYLWIKDYGKNKNVPPRPGERKWPKEGVDIDAVRLKHAYSNH